MSGGDQIMKKIATGIIIGVLLAIAIPVAAESVYEKLTATSRPDYKLFIDGKDVELQSSPKIINGTTHLPAKELASLFGKETTFKDGVIAITTPVIDDPVTKLASLEKNLETHNKNLETLRRHLLKVGDDMTTEDKATQDYAIKITEEAIVKVEKKIADLITEYPELESR